MELQHTVESDKTMLVEGPASAMVVSGKIEVFGYQPRASATILVREGKRVPFFAVERAVLDVSLGANASIQEVAGNTIPSSWNKTVEAVLGLPKKPVTVLILGQIDSGKSSFCTYLLNKLFKVKCRVAVLDGDLGQSDIGPSGTVGYGLISKPVAQLSNLKLQNAFFVGVTSPNVAIAEIIEGLAALKTEVLQTSVDFVVINTDGWVTGDLAIRYKTALIQKLKPDVIVGVQVKDELEKLIANLDIPVITVEPSPFLSPRTAENRKRLREMTYSRYLKGAKLECYPLSQVTVEPRNAIPKTQLPEKGLLVGLYGKTNIFLGIGVLRKINPLRKILKIQTAVSAKPLRIVVGKVFLDRKLREIQD